MCDHSFTMMIDEGCWSVKSDPKISTQCVYSLVLLLLGVMLVAANQTLLQQGLVLLQQSLVLLHQVTVLLLHVALQLTQQLDEWGENAGGDKALWVVLRATCTLIPGAGWWGGRCWGPGSGWSPSGRWVHPPDASVAAGRRSAPPSAASPEPAGRPAAPATPSAGPAACSSTKQQRYSSTGKNRTPSQTQDTSGAYSFPSCWSFSSKTRPYLLLQQPGWCPALMLNAPVEVTWLPLLTCSVFSFCLITALRLSDLLCSFADLFPIFPESICSTLQMPVQLLFFASCKLPMSLSPNIQFIFAFLQWLRGEISASLAARWTARLTSYLEKCFHCAASFQSSWKNSTRFGDIELEQQIAAE